MDVYPCTIWPRLLNKTTRDQASLYLKQNILSAVESETKGQHLYQMRDTWLPLLPWAIRVYLPL